MSEKRIDPAFDTQGIVAADVASLRNQLLAWCEHIAVAAIKARFFGNRSELLDSFFLNALEATCQSSAVGVRELASMCLKADLMQQLAASLCAECDEEYQKNVEAEVVAAIQAIPELGDDVFKSTVAESAGFSSANLCAQLGDSVYGLQETILAGLKGVATTLRYAIKLNGAREKREFEARGLRERIKTLSPRRKNDKELIVELTAQAEAIEAEVDKWRDDERAVLDGVVEVLAFMSPEQIEEFQSAETQPAEEQPAEEQPAEEQPAEGQPAEEQPAEEQPTEEQPAEEQASKETDPTGFSLFADSADLDALSAAALKTGELAVVAFKVFELATFYTYGAPVPTSVRTTQVPGVCVAFSGEDFDALTELLERAEFSDVNVWTRGEAIAAHSLPAFKKYRRLVGNYGGSRSEQNKELGAFPGSTVFSSPPFDEPSDDYSGYVFTVGDSCWEEVKTIPRKENGELDLDCVMNAASDSGGYSKGSAASKLPLGFGGEQIPRLVEKSARAYRTGALKRVLAIGGVDAPDSVFPEEQENVFDYYPRLFESMAKNCISLTFGDVKFRFADVVFPPTTFGTPRSIDMGRVRDMNAVLRFAADLNKELDRTPETSPVAFFISVWDERSVAALLAPCSLGYRDVFVGPYCPSVWNEEVLAILHEKLRIRLVDVPEEDVASLGAH